MKHDLSAAAAAAALLILLAGAGTAAAQAVGAPIPLVPTPDQPAAKPAKAARKPAAAIASGAPAKTAVDDHPFVQRLTALPAPKGAKTAAASAPASMPVYPLSDLDANGIAVAPLPDAVAPLPPSADALETKPWLARQGKTLRAVLSEWGKESGWSVAWKSDDDYPLSASAEFHGDFIQASTQLIAAFAAAQPPVFGEFHKGNHVLVVTTAPDANAD